jgi:hypothetical protein
MKRVTTLLLLALFALAAGGCDSSNATEDTISSRQQTGSSAVTPAPGSGNTESGDTNNNSTPQNPEESETSDTSHDSGGSGNSGGSGDSGSSGDTPVTPVKSDEGPKVH